MLISTGKLAIFHSRHAAATIAAASKGQCCGSNIENLGLFRTLSNIDINVTVMLPWIGAMAPAGL